MSIRSFIFYIILALNLVSCGSMYGQIGISTDIHVINTQHNQAPLDQLPLEQQSSS